MIFFLKGFDQTTDYLITAIHPQPLQMPKKGKIYSVNEGNARNWDAPTAKYVSYMRVSFG
jgi:fructose-1,6-bisphosphatase